eukprot:g1324.t1
MCKKLSCLAIALIAAGAVVLIGTVIGLAVHFGNAGKDTAGKGRGIKPGGKEVVIKPGKEVVIKPDKEVIKPPTPTVVPAPPAKEDPQEQAPAKWVGGPQNEVTGVAEMLGTQYIEYRRDYQQFLAEQDYEKDVTEEATTRSSLKAFPLRIDAAKDVDEEDRAKMQKHVRAVLKAAEERAGAKGKGGAKLRFVMNAKAKAGGSKMIKAQNLAHDLVTARKYADAAKPKADAREIAIVVAADGGLPGGVMSKIVEAEEGGKSTAEANIEQIHNGHDDEEGSVVSNWYVHQARAYPTITHKKFGEAPNAAASRVVELFSKALQGKWGLVHAYAKAASKDEKEDVKLYETVQGVDYVRTRNPVSFADCWVVRYAKIGLEKAAPQLWMSTEKDGGEHDEVQNPDKAVPKMTGKAYPNMNKGHKIAALLFVPAPNGNVLNVPATKSALSQDDSSSEEEAGEDGEKGQPKASQDDSSSEEEAGEDGKKRQSKAKSLATVVAKANSIGGAWPSRTLNKYATENLNFFKASLQASITAALDAAIREQLLYKNPIKVLVLEKLGAALYWPRDKTSGKRLGDGGAAKAVYKKIIDAALNEMVEVENVAGVEGGKMQLPKRAFFDDVVMSHDGRK